MLWFDYYWHKVLKRPYTLARRIDKGEGHPVVFLHGIASTGENWRQVADSLDDTQYRVIVLDLLGFGDSPRPDWLQYSVDDHAKAVIASLRMLKIRKPVILVGHSMGSLVAAYIAEKYPKKVKHLILYQMPIYADAPHMHARDLRRQAYLSVFRYLAEHPKMTLFYAKMLGRSASRLVGFTLDETTWQPFELSLRNTIMQQQSFRNLRHLRMPTDIVYGKYDLFVVRKNIQNYFRKSKYLRFYEINDLHRVSKRSNDLLVELITRNPKEVHRLHAKHARLVNMNRMKTLEKAPEKTQSSKNRYVLAGSLAFVTSIILAAFAWQGNLTVWEKNAFTYINNMNAPDFVEILARASSDIVWLAVFAVALSLLIKKFFWSAYRIAVPAVITYVVVFTSEHIIGRMRPNIALPDETISRAVQDGMGFPSGHMATIAVIVMVLWPFLTKPMRIIAVILVVLVGWSRIFLGVHFPLDIVAGLSFAVAIFCGLRLLPEQLQKRLRLT
jgi:pimeloyl-ACP methyl ester carboxylesterase/membrane-associated phospholipid phosphatase